MPSKLARSLDLTVRGEVIGVRTPLLVPSFSSKAASDIGAVFDFVQDEITDSLLISAYDLSHKHIPHPPDGLAEVLFLDSGGYEAIIDESALEPQYGVHHAAQWTLQNFRDTLAKLDLLMPTLVTTFDHPGSTSPFLAQIEAGLALSEEFSGVGWSMLVKPETRDHPFVSIANLVNVLDHLTDFDVIGLTENELGESVIERMKNIAFLRQQMDRNGITKPLHIFGSLDPMRTALYFLSGADIFDGLSWIRFTYHNDLAVYHNNGIMLSFGANVNLDIGLDASRIANLEYLRNFENRLQRYVRDGDETRLGAYSGLYAEAVETLRSQFPEIV